MLTAVQTTQQREIDNTLGTITAEKTGTDTWKLTWKGCYLGESIQDSAGFYSPHNSQPLTLPDCAHLLLVKYLDLVRTSNEYGYQKLVAAA